MADTRVPPGADADRAGEEQELRRTEHGAQVHEVAATTTDREFTVEARTQRQLVLRRFLAHKLAVGSLIVFLIMVVASMFVGVCYHAYTRYSEIHTGRATWGQFGLTVAVGAILLVVGIWLLTKATGVL